MEKQPLYLDTLSYTAREDRRLFKDILTEGIVASGDLACSQHSTPAMSVDIAAGSAYVINDEATDRGSYRCYNDALVTKTIASSDPSNGRIDRIILQVYDLTDISGAVDSFALEVLTGTPAASPAAPALPANALDIALVAVAANAVTIVNANITDQRTRISSNLLLPASIILTSPVIASLYQDAGKTKLMTVPNTASDTLVVLTGTQTLTNKTLISPTLGTPVIGSSISGTAIATGAEVTTGTDNTKIVTPKAIGDSTILKGADVSASQYVKIGNMVIQWGASDIVINNAISGGVTITFPISFKAGAIPSVNGSISEPTAISWFVPARITVLTVTNFVGSIYEVSGAVRTGTYSYKWIAIGVWQ